MINILRKAFGSEPAPDYKELVRNGALIMDVRTRSEYSGGHINGSVNYPLDSLSTDCQKIKKDRVIITCCASGMRSASARRILKSKGYEQVYNGGGWWNLEHKIK